MFHGYDEHLNRLLKPYANYLAEQGITSIGIDQRGFGQSQGLRAYFRSYDDIVSDTMLFLNKVLESDAQLKSKPLFFMGISMGGEAALYTAMKYPKLAKGVIAFSPALGMKKEVMGKASALVKFMPLFRPFSKFGFIKFQHTLSTKDPELLDNIKNDPHGYTKGVRFGTSLELLRGGNYTIKNADKMATPYIIYQGTSDRIVDTEAIKLFHSKAVNVKDKKLVLIPKGEHIVLVDNKEFEVIKKEVHEWIEKKI